MGAATHLSGLAVALGIGSAVVTGLAAPASATPAESTTSAADSPQAVAGAAGAPAKTSPSPGSNGVTTGGGAAQTESSADAEGTSSGDESGVGSDADTDIDATDATGTDAADADTDIDSDAPDTTDGADNGRDEVQSDATDESAPFGAGQSESVTHPSADPVPTTDIDTSAGTRTGGDTEKPADPDGGVAGPRALAVPITATAENSPESVTAPSNTTPAAAPALWTFLASVGRELQRTFFNSHPTANPVIIDRTAELVTGNIGAFDPDGDRLVYTIVGRGPALGRVTIDQNTGAFSYTPVVNFSTLGGSDRFTVEISDETRPHLHGLAALWEVPIRIIRSIPVFGSLLSDFLPATAPRTTVTITFPTVGDPHDLAFPDDFRWGVATAGFQVEMGGGAPLDKNSDWWQWLHDPANKWLIGWKNDSLPENGPGSYLRYAADADLAANGVGADTFRMSIEWSRIFPNSTASVNISSGITPEALSDLDALADQDEVEHYRDVLQALHDSGLDPMVTVNHFTLPLWVHNPTAVRRAEILGRTPQEEGGWVSNSTVAEFEKYSAYLAWKFGDQVSNWVVLNEPMNSMIPAYFGVPFGTGFPPAVLRPDLMAVGMRNQAAAYSASYDAIHQLDDDANVGLALSMFNWRGTNPASPIDQQAAQQFGEFFNTWFPNAVIKGEVDANFDGAIGADEVHPDLAGKADFFGINYYGQGTVLGFGGSPFAKVPLLNGYPQFANLLNVVLGGCPAEECSEAPLIVKPSGLRDVIDIAASYGKPVWITENGLDDGDDSLRSSYLVRHLAVINEALRDGVDIRGYISWSLLDNLEWILGYGPKFGLYSVDPVTLERIPRPSAAVYRAITTGNAISAELFQQYVKATP